MSVVVRTPEELREAFAQFMERREDAIESAAHDAYRAVVDETADAYREWLQSLPEDVRVSIDRCAAEWSLRVSSNR